MNKPNVIIITSDQQRYDSLGCYGSSFVTTPNLDKLAAEGSVFERAYCTNAVCVPSRASLFSGLYISRHGVYNNGINLPEELTLISHRLKNAGYLTHYIGKTHFNAYTAPFESSIEALRGWEKRFPQFRGPYYGFDTVEICMQHTLLGITGHYGCWVRDKLNGRDPTDFAAHKHGKDFTCNAYDWDIPVELHNSMWTAERVIDFLDTVPSDKPFLLAVGFQDPHQPHALPVTLAQQLDISKIPLPDYEEGELCDKPPHFDLAHKGNLNRSRYKGKFFIAGQRYDVFRGIPEEDARRARAYYYGMVELVDKAMGTIISAIQNKGLWDNTIIVFTSDHGELLGDHGLWRKGPFHYEQLVRIPLIMRFPSLNQTKRINSLVSLVDIVPTLLGGCGVKSDDAFDGIDIRPLIDGTEDVKRDHVRVETTDDPKGLRPRTIVTERYKLTCYRGEKFGELYDLINNPREKQNLWDDESISKEKTSLLLKLFDDYEPLEKRLKRPWQV